jgi:hypothetical protein
VDRKVQHGQSRHDGLLRDPDQCGWCIRIAPDIGPESGQAEPVVRLQLLPKLSIRLFGPSRSWDGSG